MQSDGDFAVSLFSNGASGIVNLKDAHMPEELLPCPTCAQPMAANAIWCGNCKLYQRRQGAAAAQTKQCPHCGGWVPVAANYCVQCEKGLGPINRKLSWIQLPVAGLSALTALLATLGLWMSNLVGYLNQDSTTEVTFSSAEYANKIDLMVSKTGSRHAYITDIFLLARATDNKDATAPLCVDTNQQPLINVRSCDKQTASDICVKFPLKVADRSGDVIKDEVTYLRASVDAVDTISQIKLESKCELPLPYQTEEELVRDILKRRSIAAVCDVYYSLRESDEQSFSMRKINGASVADCGALLFQKGNQP
ncbi:MAG: zinc ribbon domain-containing protein [Steroidobacteraceae bacterium]